MSKEIDFNVTNTERYLIQQIADRAVKLAGGPRKYSKIDAVMDITAAHCNGNALRLEELLRADNFNFSHDVFGIARHLNRETGKLGDHFSPRFTSAVPRAKVLNSKRAART